MRIFLLLDKSVKTKVKLGKGEMVQAKGKGTIAMQTIKVAKVTMVENSFPLISESLNQHVYSSKVDETWLWHKRYGHFNLASLKFMQTHSMVRDIPTISVWFLNLVDNKFYGEIPLEVGRLFRLRILDLSNNTLGGEIPLKITYSSELKVLNLTRNRLEGKIPAELGSLKKLVTLRLGTNNLTGEIPQSLGNLSSLKVFSVGFNNLHGNIPSEMGQLTSLIIFVINFNNLSGTIPPTLYNISSISLFYTSSNQLSGSLPANLGLTLHNLQQLAMGGNQFHGSVPVSLANASQLQDLDISRNFLTGQVPTNLGNLNDLQRFSLGHNFLGNSTSQDFNFITSLSNCSNLKILFFSANNFGGLLPTSIANLSTLYVLGMGSNHISGKIPIGVENLVNLYELAMEINLFSGVIPFSFGKLGKLQLLNLGGNLLSGEIPTSLGNITQLYQLYLDENKLEGKIPSSIGNIQFLKRLDISQNKLISIIPQQIFGLFSLSELLDLSQNSLTGSLPTQVGVLKNIYALDVSENKLSGKIPETIGDCLSLEILNLHTNSLQGPIPSSFASLRGLQHLDLSRNNLSGKIPEDLESLSVLQYLNLSFNNFEGEVPKKGVFRNATTFSVVGNSKLCGGIPELQLPPCPIQKKKQKKTSTIIILVTTISSVVFFMTITCLCVFYRRKSRRNPPSMPFIADKLFQISYKELFQATAGFSQENLIGQGSFGLVYRGSLLQHGDKLVAIKVLNLQQHGASKSFFAECKALTKIRHRNLVKILTCCSSIDFKGNDFKALVFDFIENGSLEMWLHPEESGIDHSRTLNLLQRLHIAIDVASALNYLHDHCEVPIIHCDLKPSNILLDSDMTAHVGDFGLARFLTKTTSCSSQGQTSSIGMKGTIGYMAPEYGIGSEATISGDVYSFGVILLEMFTGKRPIEEMFTDGLNLHNFVKAKLPRRVMQVVDPVLLTTGELGTPTNMAENMDDNDIDDTQIEIQEHDFSIENLGSKGEDVKKCVVLVLELGLACSVEVPGDRMNMRDVTRKLNFIMEAILRLRTQRAN
ncbi:putative receptor-like protein kinase At3g47110 [Hevea brasiliensis]|uniref:putative receptor-like protein kinase At3g47110 n=1 Tax=Hevea brasiliensis TaxID=3981 RepID=UPI0025F66C68|nr:putative receptor-like protein kinase At3g47110 [Hevea brasiliensis]